MISYSLRCWEAAQLRANKINVYRTTLVLYGQLEEHMLTVTIDQEQIEYEIRQIALNQHKSPDEIVKQAVARSIGLEHLTAGPFAAVYYPQAV